MDEREALIYLTGYCKVKGWETLTFISILQEGMDSGIYSPFQDQNSNACSPNYSSADKNFVEEENQGSFR